MTFLPDPFADLEPFAAWCLATERERYAKRLASTMPEMQAFYDAITPRAEAALEYCDQFVLDDLPDYAVHLVQHPHPGEYRPPDEHHDDPGDAEGHREQQLVLHRRPGVDARHREAHAPSGGRAGRR